MQYLDAILPNKDRHLDRKQYESLAKQIIDALPSSLPTELLGSLKGAIRGANSQGLGTRLQVAMDALPVKLVQDYGLDDETRQKARKARNALAHSGGRGIAVGEATIVHGRMRLVALVYTLQQIGIPDDVIVQRIANCYAWQPPVSVETL
jgi:hypothetical protein